MSIFRRHTLTVRRTAGAQDTGNSASGVGDGMGGWSAAPDHDDAAQPAEADVIRDRVPAGLQDSGRTVDNLDEGDALAFVDDVTGLQPGDDAIMHWGPDDDRKAVIQRVRRLDNTLVLAYA